MLNPDPNEFSAAMEGWTLHYGQQLAAVPVPSVPTGLGLLMAKLFYSFAGTHESGQCAVVVSGDDLDECWLEFTQQVWHHNRNLDLPYF